MSSRIAFIISHFPRSNSTSNLERLIEQLRPYKQVIIVVENSLNSSEVLPQLCRDEIYLVKRENSGMNIGAWQIGYQVYSDFDYFFFFQAESFIVNTEFLDRYIGLFKSDSRLGMIGDSLNLKWNRLWDELEVSRFNHEVFVQSNNYTNSVDINGAPFLRSRRVSFYRKRLEEWGVLTNGLGAGHLRALNWCMTKEVMSLIKFPIGMSKHECIAAEIAVSRAVIQSGYKICQSATHPFRYVGHHEWDEKGKVGIS